MRSRQPGIKAGLMRRRGAQQVTGRRHILLAAGAIGFLVALWMAVPWCAAPVQANSCTANCRAAYGSCYKSSQDRARCQAQLQRCLEGCIRSKR
jgi:hypothetical protein